MGSGAFGVVISARNILTNEDVAIKKIEHAFENYNFAIHTLRELKCLRVLSHPNVLLLVFEA